MPSRCGFVERKLQNNDSIGVEVDYMSTLD